MSFASIFPASVAALGVLAFGLAVILVFLDVPGKGVPWDKVAAGAAVVGGFGIGGAGAGWVGAALVWLLALIFTVGDKVMVTLVGSSVAAVMIAGLLLWMYSRLRGRGISAKGKMKSLVIVMMLAVAGTFLGTISGLYSGIENLVSGVTTAAQ